MNKKRNKDRHNQKQTADNQKPSRHNETQLPRTFAVKIEPSAEDADKYSKEQIYKGKQLAVARGLNWITAIAAAIALFGLTYLHGQLGEMRKANEITMESLETVQRAFVFPSTEGFVLHNEPSGKKSVDLVIRWENSGTTPTKFFHTHASNSRYPLGYSLPENFTYPELWNEGAAHVNTDAVIAPKGSSDVLGGNISMDAITSVYRGQETLFVWGWATYNDVFKHTSTHRTEFCYQVAVLDLTPSNIRARFDNCPHHNCYDEECQQSQN